MERWRFWGGRWPFGEVGAGGGLLGRWSFLGVGATDGLLGSNNDSVVGRMGLGEAGEVGAVDEIVGDGGVAKEHHHVDGEVEEFAIST